MMIKKIDMRIYELRKCLFVVLISVVLISCDNILCPQQSIDSKYCYHINSDSSISVVMGASTLAKEYEVISYYYCDYFVSKGNIYGDGLIYHNSPYSLVEILSYSSDSLVAKIRYEYYSEQRGGMHVTNEFYVPAFTLYSNPPEIID